MNPDLEFKETKKSKALNAVWMALILIPFAFFAFIAAQTDYEVFHRMYPNTDVFDWLWSLTK